MQLYQALPQIVKTELEAHHAEGPAPPYATGGAAVMHGSRSFRLIQELPLPGMWTPCDTTLHIKVYVHVVNHAASCMRTNTHTR